MKKLLGQTALYGLTTVIIRLFPFVINPIITRSFGPTAYSPFADFYSVAGVIAVILTHGMETTFFRFSLDEKDDRKLISTSFFSVLVVTLVYLFFTLLYRQPLATAFRTPDQVDLLTILAVTLALDAFCAMPFVMLRKNERPLKYAAIRITNGVINFLLVVFFIALLPRYPEGIFGLKYNPEFGIGYVFVANLVASTATFLMLFKEILITRIKYFSYELWKKMIKYSWPITIAGLAGIINETFDRQFLKFLLPEEIGRHQLGVYGGVAKVVTFVILFRQAYSLGIEPFFFSNSKNANAKLMYVRLMDIFVAVNCLIVLFLSVNLDWIAKGYIQNPEYYEGIPILPILFFASLFLGIYLNLSIWYKLTDKTIIGAYISTIGVLITIGINFYFIPKYGYWASTWATIASYFAMMVISYVWGQYRYPIPYNVYKNSVIILITMLVSLASYQYLREKIWLGNLIFLILATILLKTENLIPQKILNKLGGK
ncbi:lipopolysaccharide biosynthesis protein [Chryseobacterium sp. SC28]|uniref:lipopolysaccharide biosynthesis protein n=1 Tax=Chryseobacterium sp. SC28 TaxID=2268028 RepID=UPI001E2C2554|nr:oligosaccharide flippase family protein [Chryseobacterium sp. SC28]